MDMPTVPAAREDRASLQLAQVRLAGSDGVEGLHGPVPGVIERRRRYDHAAGNQFLGLDERPVGHAGAIPGVPVAPALLLGRILSVTKRSMAASDRAREGTHAAARHAA